MRYLVSALIALSICGWTVVSAADQINSQEQVSAYVQASCRFSSSALTLSFGELDPASTAPATAVVTTKFWCTKGTSATLSSNGGLYNNGKNRMKHASVSEYIPYTLTLTASSLTGGGKNVARELSINGYVANSDFVNARVGNYSDTVEIRITP
jgi:spore coat protein U-like protein